MAGDRRSRVGRRKLEDVAVEEDGELLAFAGLPHSPGESGHAVGHGLLLESVEIHDLPLAFRKPQNAAGMGVANLGRGRLDRVEGGRVVAPGLAKLVFAGIVRPQPLAPGVASGGRVAREFPFPRAAIEPLARVMPAGMVASYVVAKGLVQVANEGRQHVGRVLAILLGSHGHALGLRAVFPDHDAVRILLLPPLGRLHTDAGQQEHVGIHLDHVAANGVGGCVVGFFSRLGPRHGHGQADEIDARIAGQSHLVFKYARRRSQLDKYGAGPVEGKIHVTFNISPQAKGDSIGAALFERQVRMVIDVEVRPLAACRLGELQPKRAAVTLVRAGYHVDFADRVLLAGGPEGPFPLEVLHSILETAVRNHLPPRAFLHDTDIVQQHRPRLLTKTQMHGGVLRLCDDRFEGERNSGFAFCHGDLAPAGDPEEHPPADGLAVHMDLGHTARGPNADLAGENWIRNENRKKKQKRKAVRRRGVS